MLLVVYTVLGIGMTFNDMHSILLYRPIIIWSIGLIKKQQFKNYLGHKTLISFGARSCVPIVCVYGEKLFLFVLCVSPQDGIEQAHQGDIEILLQIVPSGLEQFSLFCWSHLLREVEVERGRPEEFLLLPQFLSLLF